MAQFKTEFLPQDLNVQTAHKTIQGMIDHYASQGWDFVQLAQVSVAEHPGCLGQLFGRGKAYGMLTVLVFRSVE